MPDFAPDAFNIWGNFNKDKKKDGHYWAAMDVPVAELRKLVEWIKTADRCENHKGEECVKLRANLMPRIAKESGNAIKQVNKNGMLLWEVSHGGMTRYFKYDWQANFHYEAAVRLYRSRITGKHS